MSEQENNPRGDDSRAKPVNEAAREEVRAKPVYDDTDVDQAALKDANSTTPEMDRTAFNPRGRLKAAGNAGKAAILVGAAFMGFVAYSMADRNQQKPTTEADASFKLDDATAEHAAGEAAAVVVRPDGENNPYALQPNGTDPFGNPIVGGPAVPAIGGEQAGPTTPAEQERQQRLAALEKERARQDAMRRAPIMAVSQQAAGPLSGNRQQGGREPFDNLRIGSEEGGEPGGPRPVNALAQSLNSGMDIPRVSASRIGNRNFLITAGAQIPCVLQNAMDSTQPGLTSCIIPHDVWSANGSVILLEKGTRVLGEYSGGFSRGQNRLFVLWNRAITPSGVSVSLGSPAADQLGRSGLGGKVDTFFWQRFGGALLLSVLGDAGSALSNEITGVDETIGVPNEAASAAVQDGGRIQPRLRAPQGREMTIMVARDVDFSNVYSLRLR